MFTKMFKLIYFLGSYRCSFNGTVDETSIDANTLIHLYVYDKRHLLTTVDDFDFQQFVQVIYLFSSEYHFRPY